jgi:F-type H+-transporting ATPase subunit gamma
MAAERERKRVGYIVVSTDRGPLRRGSTATCSVACCWRSRRLVQGVEPVFCTIGTKALGFFKRFGGNVLAQATHLGDKPHIEDLIGTVKVMLDAFEAREIDAIYVATTSSSTP